MALWLIEGVGSVIYVGLVYAILVYGFVSTFGNSMGGDKICKIVDKAYSFAKWFFALVFISGAMIGWQKSMLIGTWCVVMWFIKMLKGLFL